MRDEYIPDHLLRRFIETDLSNFYYSESEYSITNFVASWIWTADHSSINSLRQKLQFYFGSRFPELYLPDLKF